VAKFEKRIKEDVGYQALRQALQRICERSQPLFPNRLEINFYNAKDDEDSGDLLPTAFFISEIRKVYWLGFIPYHKSRTLISVIPKYSGEDGVRNYTIHDPSISNIVEEELSKLT